MAHQLNDNDTPPPVNMLSSTTQSAIRSAALAFLPFLNRSVTPFHAVEACEAFLKGAGFVELSEHADVQPKPKDRFYIKKSESSIFAFTVGGAFKPCDAGFSIVVAHTDSPCLRVKPISKKTSEKFLQLGVAPYGGGLWRTWFDRDLSLAGQVVFRNGDAILHRLIDLRRPILNIPSLAIHLDTERNKFELNTELHLRPILAHISSVEKCGGSEEPKATNDEEKSKTTKNCERIVGEHHELFLKEIAAATGCKIDELLDMDLYLYDTQPATLSGLNEEFISGARLDNLLSSFAAIHGLVESLKDQQSFDADTNIRLVACFDNEEVGSGSAQGAESHFMEWLLRRIMSCSEHQTAFECSIGRSYMISADQAHAVHPNYAQKHEDQHKPTFNGGLVVKVNANQRYATTAITHSVLKVIADIAGVPLQKVVVRNDSPCGSTVGPILAANLGIQTVDIGAPQLAMHSIRELGDTSSVHYAIQLFSNFFSHLPKVLKSVKKQVAST